jgi:hypothetical protein
VLVVQFTNRSSTSCFNCCAFHCNHNTQQCSYLHCCVGGAVDHPQQRQLARQQQQWVAAGPVNGPFAAEKLLLLALGLHVVTAVEETDSPKATQPGYEWVEVLQLLLLLRMLLV